MYLDERTHLYIPCIFAVMNNKSEITYKSIFQYTLKNLLENDFNKSNITITMDF